MTSKPTPASTFVLVHGAWHGGWCWSRLAKLLRNAGHDVYTPTLTGLGERSHLLSNDISLQTFVDDVSNVLTWEDLHDVILVGHSFAGLVISGVADAIPERIRRLIYLDAFILESGLSTFDTLPDKVVAKLEAASRQTGGTTAALPPPKPETLGLSTAADIAFVGSRLTPQPLSSYKTALQLHNALGNGLPCTYLHCINPVFPAIENTSNWVKTQPNWRWEALDSGHAVMVSHPELLYRTLLAFSHDGT